MTQIFSLFKTVLIKNIFEENGLILSEQVFKLITSTVHITVHRGHLLHHALLKGIIEKRDFSTAQKPNVAKKVVAFFAFCSGKCRNVWFSLLILVL
jgi:hypothetical protein